MHLLFKGTHQDAWIPYGYTTWTLRWTMLIQNEQTIPTASIFLDPVNHISKINSLNSVYFLNIFITSLTIIYSNVKSSKTTNCNQDDMVKYETQVQHSMMKQWHKNEGDFLQLIIWNKTFIGIYFCKFYIFVDKSTAFFLVSCITLIQKWYILKSKYPSTFL